MTVFPFHWLAALALGCGAVVCAGQAADLAAPHTFRGQVVDSVTGQPIARALVRIQDNDVLTDHEGRFSLESSLQSGAVPAASKPGYFNDFPGPVAAGGPLLLRLTPEAVVYGTVTDANLQPIQHLHMQLRQIQLRAGLAQWQPMGETETNAEGEFRFAELAAGEYTLATGFLVDGIPDAASSLAFAPRLYPPARPEGGGDALTLRAGDRVAANLTLTGEKLHPVSGVVHGSHGGGTGFSVETLEGLNLNPNLRFFADSGVFRCLLPSGSYRLAVQAEGEQQRFAGEREINVGPAGLEGVQMVLTPLPSIPVEVEIQRVATRPQETSAPPYPGLSLAGEDPTATRAFLRAEEVVHGAARQIEPGDPMVFRFVPPGRYVLQADENPPWYVASAACGNVDLIRDLLEVTSGSGACSLRAVLRDDSASLQWSVMYPEGARGQSVTVMAFPLANLVQNVGGLRSFTSSDGDRTAGSIEGLAPGRYLVIAARKPLNVAYRDHAELEKYRSWGKEVTLTPNSKTDMELELAAGEP